MGYFAKFKAQGIDFMEGAEKRDIRELVDEKIHIIDYGFIKGDNGDFAVLKVKEHEGKFYFAPTVISENIRTIDADGMKDALAKIVVIVRANTSKNGREYFSLEYIEK